MVRDVSMTTAQLRLDDTDKAIQVLQQKLAEDPRDLPEPPPYPVRAP